MRREEKRIPGMGRDWAKLPEGERSCVAKGGQQRGDTVGDPGTGVDSVRLSWVDMTHTCKTPVR